MTDSPISRRTAMKTTGAAVLATAAAAAAASPASAQNATYLPREAVSYQPNPHTETCSACGHWTETGCRAVEGATEPNGWCAAYVGAP